MRTFLALLVLAGCVTMAYAAQNVSFAKGRASVPLPESFRVTTSGDDLVATFGAGNDHSLELTLLETLSKPDGTRDLAVAFVEEQGRESGKNVHSRNGRAVLMESGEQEKRGDKTYQAAHWQIAVGNCLFTMTVTAPLPMSKELDEFLGEPLNAIVNQLSCTSA